MAHIPPITDAEINDAIKSNAPYLPSLAKTQGYRLRELVKLLRDRLEQEINDKYDEMDLAVKEKVDKSELYDVNGIVKPELLPTDLLKKTGGDMTGTLQLAPGTSTNAPLKFPSGGLTTTPQDGALERGNDGELYFTKGTERKKIGGGGGSGGGSTIYKIKYSDPTGSLVKVPVIDIEPDEQFMYIEIYKYSNLLISVNAIGGSHGELIGIYGTSRKNLVSQTQSIAYANIYSIDQTIMEIPLMNGSIIEFDGMAIYGSNGEEVKTIYIKAMPGEPSDIEESNIPFASTGWIVTIEVKDFNTV